MRLIVTIANIQISGAFDGNNANNSNEIHFKTYLDFIQKLAISCSNFFACSCFVRFVNVEMGKRENKMRKWKRERERSVS